MFFRGNMTNDKKEICIQASKASGLAIEFREPSKHLPNEIRKNHFALWGPYDMSDFWSAYRKLEKI